MDITKATQILAEAAGITEKEFHTIFESIEINHIVRSSNPDGELKIWLGYRDLSKVQEFRKRLATYIQFHLLIDGLGNHYCKLIGDTVFNPSRMLCLEFDLSPEDIG